MLRLSWMVIQVLFFLGMLVGLVIALSILFNASIDSYDEHTRAGDIRIVGAPTHIGNDRMNGRRIAVYMDIENADGMTTAW